MAARAKARDRPAAVARRAVLWRRRVDAALPAAAVQALTSPRFTVVIPTHQRRETVRRIVTALGRQTYEDFEVVVVDDGSSDGTASALHSLPVTFPLKVLEQ